MSWEPMILGPGRANNPLTPDKLTQGEIAHLTQAEAAAAAAVRRQMRELRGLQGWHGRRLLALAREWTSRYGPTRPIERARKVGWRDAGAIVCSLSRLKKGRYVAAPSEDDLYAFYQLFNHKRLDDVRVYVYMPNMSKDDILSMFPYDDSIRFQRRGSFYTKYVSTTTQALYSGAKFRVLTHQADDIVATYEMKVLRNIYVGRLATEEELTKYEYGEGKLPPAQRRRLLGSDGTAQEGQPVSEIDGRCAHDTPS